MRATELMLRVQARKATAEGRHDDANAAVEKAVKLAASVGGRENRQRTNFFPTPPELAAELAGLLKRKIRWDGPLLLLEPSAGNGNLVRALHEEFRMRDYFLTAIEPERGLAEHIGKHFRHEVRNITFEEYGPDVYDPAPEEAELRFDGILMNPPFNVPGNRTIWIDHVRKAWDMLAYDGTLVAIVPNSFSYREDRKYCEIRELIEEHGDHYELPGDTFANSGTSTITRVIWATKP
ncbi:Hypothetical protein AJAP_42850 (plasmid) [Amycolatopsis japonica]|uniref:Uncharacterized protein n=1 Tax=Amycolatopsis japonica TaxID=208439 RepID=A0A075V4P3_9PSEU|nr:SAM-dependent methyltransferase [Amycolatopsis japonica]AIG81337.1 Hypothetical protein AJAP_42850 [Amycolatopsis japonica]